MACTTLSVLMCTIPKIIIVLHTPLLRVNHLLGSCSSSSSPSLRWSALSKDAVYVDSSFPDLSQPNRTFLVASSLSPYSSITWASVIIQHWSTTERSKFANIDIKFKNEKEEILVLHSIHFNTLWKLIRFEFTKFSNTFLRTSFNLYLQFYTFPQD